jgi:hypothetical protein
LHLALAELPAKFFDLTAVGMRADRETITCLRSVLMKPEHEAWLGEIWTLLSRAADAVLGAGRRAELEEKRRRLDDEIRSYPTPIPRCDAQFNQLFEERDRVVRELDELPKP